MDSPPPANNLNGNHNEHHFANNESDLSFMGDNTRIHFEKNSGNLKIWGNNVQLRVDKNAGDIYFIGDCGRIFLKSESPQQSVVSSVTNASDNLHINVQDLECCEDEIQGTLVQDDNADAEHSAYVIEVTGEPTVDNKAFCYSMPSNNNVPALTTPPPAEIIQSSVADFPPSYTPREPPAQLIDDIPAGPPPPYEPPQQPEKYDLVVCGSYNRVQLTHNQGEVEILGNSTRLIIHTNAGHVKYKGDSGKICLGGGSTQQSVNYIGSYGTTIIANTPHTLNAFLEDF